MADERCGVHWLLDLRVLAAIVIILVALVVGFTRLMR